MFAIGSIEILIILCVMVGLPLLLIVGVIKGLKSGTSGPGIQSSLDEARLVQQIYEDLQRMEKRVESLETLLLDRARDHERA